MSKLDELKRENSIESVLFKNGIAYSKKPIQCPFHNDSTPSFNVYADGGRWKCFGCGKGGDVVDLLAEFEGVTVSEYLNRASKKSAAKEPISERKKLPKAVDWPSCVEAFTEGRANELSKYRGYPLDFVKWLHDQALIGIHSDQFALPIHDDEGQVVGIHHKHPDGKWRTIGNTAPLIIGERTGKKWLVFESQWDAFSVMETLCFHVKGYESPYSVLITRGADNGKFSAIIPEDAEAIVVMQNDQPKKDGLIPSEKWLSNIQEKCPATLRIARPPKDLKDCNDWLRRGDSDFNKMLANTEPGNPMDRILEARAFNVLHPPEKPFPVLSIGGRCIATAGNLVALTGQAKSGKSAFESAMIASLMEPDGDCLGVKGSNYLRLPVLHLDTEQSQYDHYQVVLQALRRAGRTEPPEWFHSYSLADISTLDRRKLLAHAMARVAANGRLCAVFLDGSADLCIDPNDPKEAFGLVEELHRLAITYSCPIICILHENPGENSMGKTRGHLGSQLERKAETNLRLSKDDGITTAFTERSRHCHIPKGQGPRFQWCDEKEMHMSCTHEDKPAPKKDKSKYDVQVLLAVGEIMPKEALISKAQALPMGLNKAKGFISELVSDGIFRVIEKPRSRTNPELHLERLI